MSSANGISFIVCFPICMTFISICCFILLAETSSPVLHKSGENRCSCFGPYQVKKKMKEEDILFYFTVKCDVSGRFFVRALCQVGENLSIPFSDSFGQEGMEIEICEMRFLGITM